MLSVVYCHPISAPPTWRLAEESGATTLKIRTRTSPIVRLRGVTPCSGRTVRMHCLQKLRWKRGINPLGESGLPQWSEEEMFQ